MGLEYLHMNGIIHRDIKPDNLLVTRSGYSMARYKGGNGMLKIADFGTSALYAGDGNAQRTAGTPPFFAPELCTPGSEYDARVVDLWAVGITMYQWCCGRLPFEAETAMLLMSKIANAEPRTAAPPEASAGLASVIESLLTREPANRLTLIQLRLHAWLTNNDEQPLPKQPVMKVEVRRRAEARHCSLTLLAHSSSPLPPRPSHNSVSRSSAANTITPPPPHSLFLPLLLSLDCSPFFFSSPPLAAAAGLPIGCAAKRSVRVHNRRRR